MALRKVYSEMLKVSNCSRTSRAFSCKSTSKEIITEEKKYSANNYEPVPVVLRSGKGVDVWDVEGKHYLDFLAGYATLNTGHCHPELIQTLTKQAQTLHHTARAFHNDVFPEFAEFVTKYFHYNKVLPMNTGVEGGETAVKIARRWGYMVKKIKENEAVVVFPEANFWGRTLSAVSTSTNPTTYSKFGPYMPGFTLVPYNDLQALEEAIKKPNVCAFMMEPIQGEAGVIVPDTGYLAEVRKMCTKYNVLWIADEIQTGLGRTGRLLACDHENVRPDILIIGKGLAGGFMPASAVLANESVMDVITPGSHGSTFGGNPLACKVAMRVLELIKEENLIENAAQQGKVFLDELTKRLPKEIVPIVRGKGLMNALVVNPDYGSAMNLCLKLAENGLLSKPCNDTVLRFTPPLMVNSAQMKQGVDIIESSVRSLKKIK